MPYTVVTNNPKVRETYEGTYAVRFVQGETEAVYALLEDLLQQGHVLVTSPLPANVPLIRSPVRSVLIEKGPRQYDGEGLLLLEKARERVRILGKGHRPDDVDDLEMLDLDHVKKAFTQL